MRISVTQKDIENGDPKNCQHCPVALAVRRTLNLDYDSVLVNDVIKVGNQDFDAPAEVVEFIVRFDEGELVEPFEFDLPIEV